MKVAIINTFSSGGGAAIAAKRLLNALSKKGVNATFIAAKGESSSSSVIISKSLLGRVWYKLCFIFERLIIWITNHLSKRNLFAISIANCGCNIQHKKSIKDADIIHVHWINQGFLSIKGVKDIIKLGKPVVITLHDMWFATAICHHSLGCTKYTTGCMECKMLTSPSVNDISAKVWRKKVDMFNDSNVTFIAISEWMERVICSSAITGGNKTVLIPNIINCNIFKPHNREGIRCNHNFTNNDIVIMFGAAKVNDPIKGCNILFNAIANSKFHNRITLVIFGNIKGYDTIFEQISCKYRYIGSINNESELAEWYSAADIVAVPSHYETFGQVVAEAMGCGTPVVSFNNAGQRDIITDKVTGYLANYPSTESFTEGIDWVIENQSDDMRSRCSSDIVERYSPNFIAERYINLYNSLIKEEEEENE